MPLHPAIRELLTSMAESGAPPLHELSPAEARAGTDALVALGGEGAEVAAQTEREIGGVRAVVYTPHGDPGPDGLWPVLVWIHGGGWVICSPETHAAVARDLCAGAGCIVVSLDYRLAPEHPAPAAAEDCRSAVAGLLEHAAELGGDPQRIAVGGDSAGGNLAALMAIEFGRRLVFQLLVYPVTDLTGSSPSIVENGTGYFLEKSSMDWFTAHYLDGSGIAPDDPRVSPAFASDEQLAATPPAFVVTAEFDPLRDEGEAYAERLRSLGVETTSRRFDGMIHAFYGFQLLVPESGEAIGQSAELLAKAFA